MMSKREKRMGIIAGIVIGALALDSTVISPLEARRKEANDRIADATAALVRADQLFQNDLRARRIWKELSGDSLRPDASTAESQVLNAARRWAQDAGLTLTSLKPERSEREQGFVKITVRATGTGSLRRVARFLYSVQNADIPIRVSDIQIDSRNPLSDELSIQLGLATIYLPPEDSQNAMEVR